MNFSEKAVIDLGRIQQTLLLPLVGRAKASDMNDGLIYDKKAKELLSAIGPGISDQIQSVDMYAALCYASRALKMENSIKSFVSIHPKATIINIGAGLDTIFYRVDNNLLRWYDLDLPDVIRFRKKYLPEGSRNTCISKSLFDYSWFNDIDKTDNGIFMVAAGVLMYFSECEVKNFLIEMSQYFPEAEFLFDSLAPNSILQMNEMISKSKGKNVEMQWGIDDASEIRSWSNGIKVIGQSPYFDHIERKKAWGADVLKEISETDGKNLSSFIHLKFER